MDPMVESALIAAAATLIGVGGTVIVSITGSRDTRLTTERLLNAARESQLTALESQLAAWFADRYSRAIEQLGADTLDVRTGGIYALEGIGP